MKIFKELCLAHIEFMQVLEQKSKLFSDIHRLVYPFDEEVTDIYIGEDEICISYKIYSSCGRDYDVDTQSIPMSFFESVEGESEERQRTKDKHEQLQELGKELVKLDNEKQRLFKQMNAMQQDIDAMRRLSQIYEIQKTEKFVQEIKSTDEARTKHAVIQNDIENIKLKMNVLRYELQSVGSRV